MQTLRRSLSAIEKQVSESSGGIMSGKEDMLCVAGLDADQLLVEQHIETLVKPCLLYTSPSPRD